MIINHNEFKQHQQLYEQQSAERKQLQKDGLLPDWYTTAGWQLFSKKYAVPTEQVGVKERFKNIAKVARHLPEEFREYYEARFFALMWKGILIPSSPILANCGTDRGMVVSCSGQFVSDSIDDFYTSLHESAILSKNAFGTSADFSSIRPRGTPFHGGGKANGAKDVIDDFFTMAQKVSQGSSRRGSFAAYIDIEHDDFYECLDSLKTHSDGKNYGWVIKDSFIQKLINGDKDAIQRFKDVIKVKLTVGKGYLFFVDKANRQRPQMYKDLGLDIVATNLCSEVILHSSPEYTYSCILTSLNLKHWDYIQKNNVVADATVFLDCITSEFIEQSKNVKGLEKVHNFTVKGRAIGLGVMGFQTYLQDNMIAYEDLYVNNLNHVIFKHIHDESLKASQWLATILGEPEWCKGYGVRHTHRTCLPPTKSSSILAGNVSESVFPDPAIIYESASAGGELPRINPRFYHLMKERNQYTKETLNSIINKLGSVQHLDWLTEQEKRVFRTAFEINQDVLLRYASHRQQFICQGQSLNFFFPADGAEEKISEIMTRCVLDPNILSQYYIYSQSGVVVNDECIACQA